MRVALDANERSGKGTTRKEIEDRLRSLGAELVDEAQAERLIVAGGDGSVAAVAERAGRLGVPLAVLAVGTANDFARATELPTGLDEACELAVRGTRVRDLELGRHNGRPFVNVCSAGLAVDAARSATRLKKALGPVAYAAGALRAGVRAHPVRCRATCDGREVFDGQAWQVIVACTGHFGAGSHLAHAKEDDGLLDLAVVPGHSRVRLVQRAYGLRRGHLTTQRGVTHCRGTEIVIDDELAYNLDGEITEPAAARFSVEPDAYALVVPD